MHSPARRLLAQAIAAALVTGVAASSVWADAAAPANSEVAVVVKIVGIPWFNRFGEGVTKAGKQLNIKATQVGPTQADPAQQVKVVEDLIARNVGAIAVVPDDAHALEPVLKRARDKGITVVTHESPGQVGAQWDVETIDNREFAVSVFQKLADLTGGEGTFVLIVGSLTTPLHKEWADTGLAYLKEKYPKLTLISDRYGVGESLDDSYRTATEILKAHPDLKGVVAFGSQGPIGFARALEQQGFKPGQVKVVGNALPKQAAPYIKKGYIDAGFLWDPSDAGFALVALADKVRKGEPIEDGWELPGLGKATVDKDNHIVRFKAARVFTKSNVDQFNF
ncbi:substrate-binding domain-containing protein [Pararobbsia silviterrae]|uniref:Autoinducer 2 ABC transporter substrate-binding protein n=1 Tax=Pararobbsia silviterrae TaxID=1792498 RepID=A0A494XFW4_9BURK|nr:substrate-binding domain-containing protein [Pararobbsia silviterrae]RKP49635.1 autoinducer 2 ABC transporter substrate-binding protein [Pararobbsia silviterrae]